MTTLTEITTSDPTFTTMVEERIAAYVTSLACLEQPLKLRAVGHVDNQGEPCEHCQLEGRYVFVTLYGNQEGERYTTGCCVPCIPAVASSEFDAETTIVAEVAE